MEVSISNPPNEPTSALINGAEDSLIDSLHQHTGFDCRKDLNLEIYAELRKLAARRMAQSASVTFQPTMLVNEAWLRMSVRNGRWKDRKHFLATAAITMRHILIDNARRKASLRHGKGLARTETGRLGNLPANTQGDDILLIDDGLRELEKVHPVWAQVVVGRFFGGLSNAEIAESLDIGERSVERYWAVAKLWLFKWVENVKHQ